MSASGPLVVKVSRLRIKRHAPCLLVSKDRLPEPKTLAKLQLIKLKGYKLILESKLGDSPNRWAVGPTGKNAQASYLSVLGILSACRDVASRDRSAAGWLV